MYLIFLETRVIGLYYILPLMISIYLHSGALRKTILFLQEGRFSRSRSSKVTDAGANRERVCDFLLLRNSNLGPISCTVSEILHVFALLAPPVFHPNFGVFSLHQIARVEDSDRISKLSYLAVKLFSKNSSLCDHGT